MNWAQEQVVKAVKVVIDALIYRADPVSLATSHNLYYALERYKSDCRRKTS